MKEWGMTVRVTEIDLHAHTVASDGVLTAEQLVALAAERGLRVLAVTDHDTTGSIDAAIDAARAYPDLRIIPGIEINTDITLPHRGPDGGPLLAEVHVLGYFIDHHNPDLQTLLQTLRAARIERARQMVAKLNALGISVEFETVVADAREAIARPHITRAAIAGHEDDPEYVARVKRYVARDGAAYVERYQLTPVQAVDVIRRASGLPVLAHPLKLPDLPTLLDELQPAGLIGMESYYGRYAPADQQYLADLCAARGLVATGGSDFHGRPELGDPPLASVHVPWDAVRCLAARRVGGDTGEFHAA
jgi:3',5'-nucleoside bisphosphate phosphatase